MPNRGGQQCAIDPTTTRMLIIGCGGSGKSTLARRISEKTGLPLIHLDAHFWHPGWKPVETKEWERTVDDLLRKPMWIMDGNYGGTMRRRIAACTTIVFLDIPTAICLWRVVKRRVVFAGRNRPDMGDGCTERLTWEFIRYILRYRTTRRPRILALLDEAKQQKDVIVLKDNTGMQRFLDTLRQVCR